MTVVYDLVKYRRAKKLKEALAEPKFQEALVKTRRNMAKTPEERAQDDLRWAEKQAQEMITGSITLACCQHCEIIPRGLGVLIQRGDAWQVECCDCKTVAMAGFTPSEAAYHWNLHHMHRLKQNFW